MKEDLPITPTQLLKTLCGITGWQLTNLQIQKILYIITLFFLGRKNKFLINEDFEAWDYGPVIKSLYKEINFFGSDIVEDIFFNVKSLSENHIAYQTIKELGLKLSGVKASKLINITHRKDSAWYKSYEPYAHGNIISRKDMIEEYKNFYDEGKN